MASFYARKQVKRVRKVRDRGEELIRAFARHPLRGTCEPATVNKKMNDLQAFNRHLVRA